MTFEQWWAHQKWEGLNVSTPQEAIAARRIAVSCWNAALEGMRTEINIERRTPGDVFRIVRRAHFALSVEG